ncbi:MAG: hypothetical protein ACE5IP_05795 [Terriglobia bacterium]
MFDDDAIQRVSRDRSALLHGWLFFSVGLYLQVVIEAVTANLRNVPYALEKELVDMTIALLPGALIVMAMVGLWHVVIRLVFHGSGSYWGLLRPMLLASVINWLAAVPLVGSLLGIWSMAIGVAVCKEIEDVTAWKAIAAGFLSAIPIAFLLLFVLGVPAHSPGGG